MTLLLDTGEAFVLTPDKDFRLLHSLLNNPVFAEELENSLDAFNNGDVGEIEFDDSV